MACVSEEIRQYQPHAMSIAGAQEWNARWLRLNPPLQLLKAPQCVPEEEVCGEDGEEGDMSTPFEYVPREVTPADVAVTSTGEPVETLLDIAVRGSVAPRGGTPTQRTFYTRKEHLCGKRDEDQVRQVATWLKRHAESVRVTRLVLAADEGKEHLVEILGHAVDRRDVAQHIVRAELEGAAAPRMLPRLSNVRELELRSLVVTRAVVEGALALSSLCVMRMQGCECDDIMQSSGVGGWTGQLDASIRNETLETVCIDQCPHVRTLLPLLRACGELKSLSMSACAPDLLDEVDEYAASYSALVDLDPDLSVERMSREEAALIRGEEVAVGAVEVMQMAVREGETWQWTLWIAPHHVHVVDCVTYYLDASFRPNKIVSKAAPFELTRRSSTPFSVQVKLDLKNEHVANGSHMLQLTEGKISATPIPLAHVIGSETPSSDTCSLSESGGLSLSGSGAVPPRAPPVVVISQRCEEIRPGRWEWVLKAMPHSVEGVQSITYQLHPPNGPLEVVETTTPFAVARCGWEQFEVAIEVRALDGSVGNGRHMLALGASMSPVTNIVMPFASSRGVNCSMPPCITLVQSLAENEDGDYLWGLSVHAPHREFVAMVEFELHDGGNPQRVEVSVPPFGVERVARAVSAVGIRVQLISGYVLVAEYEVDLDMSNAKQRLVSLRVPEGGGSEMADRDRMLLGTSCSRLEREESGTRKDKKKCIIA